MEELSLTGDIKRNVVLEKICAQSKKDGTGRRKSFRVTQQEIRQEVESKKE